MSEIKTYLFISTVYFYFSFDTCLKTSKLANCIITIIRPIINETCYKI